MSRKQQQPPLDITRFVQLNTKKKLKPALVTLWYSSVLRSAPSGVVTVVPAINDNGRPASVQMVHRKTADHHCYLIPLTRDLRDEEVEPIVHRFAKAAPDLDFEVETNETKLIAKEYGEIPMDAAKHVALCMALAKQQHEEWMRDQADAGWRYGTTYSKRDKTHPMILPWDQLPDRFRKPNTKLPQTLLDFLNSHGYAVLHREELDRLLDLLKDDSDK
jgi:hypothetical protein